MANKFILWCEDENATQDYNTFVNDPQRQAGFQGGQPASAIRVNTALRQANLVSAAIMNALLPDNQTLNYRNDIPTVANAINTALTSKIQTTKVNNAGTSDNVTTNINGQPISTIFETNGTTVKNATYAARAGIANNVDGSNISVSMYLTISTGNPDSTYSEQTIGPLTFRGVGIKVGSRWYGNLYYDCLQNKGQANISDIFAIKLGRPQSTSQSFVESGLMFVHTIMSGATNETWTLLYPENGYNYISNMSAQEYRSTTKFTLNRDGTGNYRSSRIVYGVTMTV